MLRLRPAGSPEALVSAPRMPKACPRLRPASADQPPGRPYRPYRPRLRHVCRPSRGFAEQPSSTTITIAAPSASGMSRLPSGSSSTGSALSHGQAAASPTWYRIRMRVRVGVSDPAAHAGKHSVHGRAVSRYPNDTACTIELGGRAAVRWLVSCSVARAHKRKEPSCRRHDWRHSLLGGAQEGASARGPRIA